MDPRSHIGNVIVEGALFSQSGETSAQRLREAIKQLELHYYRSVLGRANGDAVAAPDLSFMENAALHLINVVTRRDAAFSEEDTAAALSVAALVFEMLSRSSNNKRTEYILHAALCNSLSGYESNASVLLRDIVGDVFAPNYSIRREYEKAQSHLSLASFIVLAFLARGLRPIAHELEWIRTALRQSQANHDEELQAGRFHLREYHVALAYGYIALASIDTVAYMLSGDEHANSEAGELSARALFEAREAKDADAYWLADLFKRARERMVSNSIWQLLGNELPHAYLELLASAKQPVVELWTSQVEALRAKDETGEAAQGGFLNERYKRIFVTMPTSAGKSLLAELAIVKEFSRTADGGICFYVVPSRALINEVVDKLSDRLFDLGIEVRRALSGYDELSFERDILSMTSRTILVLTPEKLSLLLHQNDDLVNRCLLFVFDEVHNISEGTRGWTLETVLTWVSNLKPETRQRKMLFISGAVNIAANGEFVMWLTDDGQLPHLVLSTQWRPTRQSWAVCRFPQMPMYALFPGATRSTQGTWEAPGRLTFVNATGGMENPDFRSIENVVSTRQTVEWNRSENRYKPISKRSDGPESHAAQLAAKLARLGPVLVYFPKVDSLAIFANLLAELLQEQYGRAIPPEVSHFLKERLDPDYALSKWIERGIGFHHGRLPLDVRAEVERQYREGAIWILASTTTLAEGVNLPTRSLVVADTNISYRKTEGLSVQKFRNMLGRAGRAMKETEGLAVFVENPGASRSWDSNHRGWHGYFFPNADELSPKCFIDDYDNEETLAFFGLLDKACAADQLQLLTEGVVSSKDRGIRDEISDTARRIQAFLLAAEAHDWLGSDETELTDHLVALLRKTYTGRTADPNAIELLRKFASHATTSTRRVLSREQTRLISMTGLPPKSCEVLLSIVDRLWETYHSDWPEDSESLAESVLQAVVGSIPEAQPPLIRRGTGNSKIIEINHSDAALAWTFQGLGPREIAGVFFGGIVNPDLRLEKTFYYIGQMFEYRLPWVLSALCFLLRNKAEALGVQFAGSDTYFHLSILPALVRFGVDSPAAALFSSLGVPSARAARFLAKQYAEVHPNGWRDFRRMYDWLMSQNWADIESDETVLPLELKRTFSQLSRLRTRSVALVIADRLACHIAGWQYYDGERALRHLRSGVMLRLMQEPDNEYDSNAVAIYFDQAKLGYVPAHLSKEIVEELDRRHIHCTVKAVNPDLPPWQKVEVEISRFKPRT